MKYRNISQQTIHEYIRCCPKVVNEDAFLGKLQLLSVDKGRTEDLQSFPDDWFEGFKKNGEGEYKSHLFERIDIEVGIERLRTILTYDFRIADTPLLDPARRCIYLKNDGMIAALIYVTFFEKELREAALYIRALIEEDYRLLSYELSEFVFAFSLLFLYLVAKGYLHCFSDLYHSKRIIKELYSAKKYAFSRDVMKEVYPIQLEFCKLIFI